jgi:hypothetical protein
MANTTVAFNVPSPYQTEQRRIEQQQKMAEMLQAQSMQPTERFSYQGIEAPIPVTAGLAKMLQGFTAGMMQKKGLEEEKALGDKYQSDLISTLGRSAELTAGKPAVAEQQPITRVDDEGYPMPVVAATPAVAPNPQAGAMEYFKHPALAPMGMAELQSQKHQQEMITALKSIGINAPSASPTQALGAEKATGGAAGPTIMAGNRIGIPNAGLPIDPRAAALLIQSINNPALGKAAEWIQKGFEEQNKPTDKIRELRSAGIPEGSPAWNFALTDTATQGGIWRRDPVTGNQSLAPGYAIGQGLIKESETAGTAKNAISTREVGGRNVTGTDEQFKYLATGTAPTDALAQSTTQWASRNGINATISSQQTPSKASNQTVLQGGIGGGTVANPTAGQKAGSITREETRAKNEVGREEYLLRTGFAEANSMLNNLDLMQSLSADPSVSQGKLADQISGLKSIGQSLGIKTEGLPAEEVIRAISIEMALKAKHQGGTNLMPGAMAVAETQMLQSMTPQLAQSKDGRDLLIQVFRQKALRDQKISELATDYYDRNGKIDYNFEKEVRAYAKANPMFTPEQIKLYQDASKRLAGQK